MIMDDYFDWTGCRTAVDDFRSKYACALACSGVNRAFFPLTVPWPFCCVSTLSFLGLHIANSFASSYC